MKFSFKNSLLKADNLQVGVYFRMSQSYEQFGKYLLLEKVAAGGMAEIYLAKSAAANGLNKFFAIKRILPQFSNNEDFVSMFKEEAKVCINLNHSNVVSIFDFGIENSQFYLVMDYVEGRNLRQIINELKKSNKSFSIDQALYLVKEAAAGLDHAHRCVDAATGKPLNITHRDMSPQNVMVSYEGEIKVIDFGIAKAETEAEDTKAGTLKGKFSYMSPEQAEGQTIDPRTDVFALGIVLWELLANDRLFTGSNEAAILRKVRDCQVPPIRKINPTVPAELERIVMKALAKDRNVRYQTAANFHRDLNRFLNTQYPDFSPQDFSVFIKESFRTSYMEAREKLVTYGKIAMHDPSAILIPTQRPSKSATAVSAAAPAQSAPVAAPAPAAAAPSFKGVGLEKSADKEKSERNSVEEIKASEAKEAPVAPSGFNAEVQAKVNLDNIRAANSGNINKNIPGYYQKAAAAASASNQTRVTQVSQVSFARGKQAGKKNTGGDVWLKMSFLVALIGVSYWWVKNMASQANSKKDVAVAESSKEGKIESSSKTPPAAVKVSVTSKPDNAEIWINGKNSGVKTPGLISVLPNADVEIRVKKDGHLDYTINKKFAETSQVVATLQAVAPGFLNIKLTGGDSFTKISIDGKELIEKPPILKYPVVADRETVVSAYNPITKMTDQVKVSVKPGDSQEVNLVLGRTPASEK
jgi:serine/threonine-protein kinase